MVLHHQLAQRVRTSLIMAAQRRNMAGGSFPYKMNIRKNKFVEEWNGRREITEKAFWVKLDNIGPLLFYCTVVPYFFYTWTRKELRATGGRRFEDCL